MLLVGLFNLKDLGALVFLKRTSKLFHDVFRLLPLIRMFNIYKLVGKFVTLNKNIMDSLLFLSLFEASS